MQRRRNKHLYAVLLAVLCLAASPVQAQSADAADALRHVPELPRDAILRYTRTDLEEWRYLRTWVSEDGVVVDRHDPTRPGEAHWQLVSIDGREPTDRERRDYDRDRADHSDEEERAPSSALARMLEPGSVQPLEAGGAEQRYRYALRSPDGKRERVFRALSGELWVTQETDAPYVREVRLWNHDSFRPMLGVRIDEADVRFEFVVLDGWVLPRTVEARWSGRFLALKAFEKSMSVELTEFERVADAASLAELAASP